MKIDWKKPLGFRGTTDFKLTLLDENFENPGSKRRVILKVSDGTRSYVVTRLHSTGAAVNSTDIYAGFDIENTPVVSKGFYPLDVSRLPFRGLISLSMAKDEYSGFNNFIEVVNEDGRPVDVKFHKR